VTAGQAVTLLPRRLFHRNLLLIVGLMLVGQATNAVLLYQLVAKPRLRASAEAAQRTLRAIEAGLVALPAPERQRFVDQFNRRADDNGGAQPARAARRLLAVTRLERIFTDELVRLSQAQGTAVLWRRSPGNTLSMGLVVEQQHYWIDLPLAPLGRLVSGAALGASIAAMLLSLLGAWLIQRRINQPLNGLVAASAALARGERPEPLHTHGPTEVNTVAVAFNEMMVSLERNERERALMLAGLSHDLRTPLARMRLATEMLSDARADAELLDSLNRNIDGMDRLLAQLLDYTALGQGVQEAPVSCHLNQLVRDALALCPQQGVTLQLGDVPVRPLHPQALLRLTTNLLVNAQRHGRPPIEVATGHDAQGPWLEVRDRGPGIAPERIDTLKQPFARGDAARGNPVGAGLGLAIVERIAQAEGARFSLLPREGGGLVARVQWPPHGRPA
jgi:two-component system, OmpR family, osmolarity sensor histidine kinase EnvZ